MEKVCFLFGNRNTPERVVTPIEKAAEYLYVKFNARIFVVGQYGNFDRLAATAMKRLKERYPDITLLLLSPYHPYDGLTILPDGFDHAYYPEGMELVPRKYAIVRANELMVKKCDCAICYVKYVGNSKKLLAKMQYHGIPTLNLADKNVKGKI